jgi:hypothetical protein
MLTSNSENKIHKHVSIQTPETKALVSYESLHSMQEADGVLLSLLPSTKEMLHVILKTRACKTHNSDFQCATASISEAVDISAYSTVTISTNDGHVTNKKQHNSFKTKYDQTAKNELTQQIQNAKT